MPVLIIPFLTTLSLGIAFVYVLRVSINWLMNTLTAWMVGLSRGSCFIMGAVIGAGMGFDLGGPVTASAVANGLGADGVFSPMSSKVVGGITLRLGIGLHYRRSIAICGSRPTACHCFYNGWFWYRRSQISP